MRSSVASIVLAFLLLLILAPAVTSHNVGYSYAYKIYAKIAFEVEGVNLTDPPDPTRLVLVINGTTEFSIIELSKDSVSLRLRPNLTISGEVEPSKFQQNLEEFLRMLNAGMNKAYEVSVPLSVLGYAPYGGIQDFIWENMRVNISWFSASLNVTTAEFVTWRGVPALQLEFKGDVISTQHELMIVHIEGKSYLDSTTFLTLYAEDRATYNLSYSGIKANYLIEVKSELINVDAIKGVSSRAYGVKFEEGDSRIYVASRDLSVSSLKATGNELYMKVSGTGLGGITVFTTRNVSIKKILVDNMPANYQVLRHGDRNIIKIPLTLSEHEIKITYEKTIKSVEEIPVVQTGTNVLFVTAAIMVVPIVVLAVLLAYLLKGRKSH